MGRMLAQGAGGTAEDGLESLVVCEVNPEILACYIPMTTIFNFQNLVFSEVLPLRKPSMVRLFFGRVNLHNIPIAIQ